MKFKTVTILFLLLAIEVATATQARKNWDFTTYESGICKFNLYNYQLRKPIEAAIIFGVSRIFDTYKDTFGFSYGDDFKFNITIFGSKEDFKKYQSEQPGGIVSEEGYYYYKIENNITKYGEVVVWKSEKTSSMVSVLFHESSHFLLGCQIPWCPMWVDEGLAEYFEGLDVLGDKKRISLQKGRSWWIKHWAKEGFPIKLQKYLNLNYDQWKAFKRQNLNAAYTIGYSLVYFMMSREKTEKVLKELLWEFRKNGKNADSVKVINEIYPGGIERFERIWLKWIPRVRPYRPLRSLRKKAEKKIKSSTK